MCMLPLAQRCLLRACEVTEEAWLEWGELGATSACMEASTPQLRASRRTHATTDDAQAESGNATASVSHTTCTEGGSVAEHGGSSTEDDAGTAD